MRPASLLSVLALIPLAAAAQVYSWKDASGKVHYGDRPPAAQQKGARQLEGAPSVDAPAERKAFLEKEAATREKRQSAQEEARKKQEEQAAEQGRQENCRRARTNLAALESGQVRFAMGDDGQLKGLDGAVRDAEIARARKQVDDWCKPPQAAGK